MSSTRQLEQYNGNEIAIIGMAGRFPGAENLEQFWQNLQDGVESIAFFTEQELLASGEDPEVLRSPKYVKARGMLAEVEMFDANFFGYSPREAAIIDPQQRLFLEYAWQALEQAGYTAANFTGRIGVYAGSSMSTYAWANLQPNSHLFEAIDNMQLSHGNMQDFLTTRISYKLDLRGPSIDIQTACSTSLVAVHLACQSLLSGECDMTMAGGVCVQIPQKRGYLYEEGGVASPDGHCRAFDAQAQGTVSGDGLGIVILKRLADALNDRDTIHAVIKGSAANNDGALKVGYTAPGVQGQVAVITEALAMADISPETIRYIETHGTGTPAGDPIEIAALTRAFSASTSKEAFCAIGSVKTNIGHLDTAAGIAGLIKTVLALKHQSLPPSLHFFAPNPQIDFAHSPFYVNIALAAWEKGTSPRRAGVSSFGMGGTNVHIVLEEAPDVEVSPTFKPAHLLVLSAQTSSALETATRNLEEYFRRHPDVELADVAYTLQRGRKAFKFRRAAICHDPQDALRSLETRDPKRVLTGNAEQQKRSVVFMFPGTGDHYVNMAQQIYQTEAVFRQHVDICSRLLTPLLGIDIRNVLYPEGKQDSRTIRQDIDLRKMLQRDHVDEITQKLNQTSLSQPAVFIIEYALAQLWKSWGIQPQAMIGYSTGEYVAACLAGVLSLEDALILIARRALLIQALPAGAMLAVPLSEQEMQRFLHDDLSLAAVNGPELCVVAGSVEAVDALEQQLTRNGLVCQRISTSHAFHSSMMEPIVAPFTEAVKACSLKPALIPYVSTVTGNWITDAEATNPVHWAKHLCQPVYFARGMQHLLQGTENIFLEIGPGQTLSVLTQGHPDKTAQHMILSSLRYSYDRQSDCVLLFNTLGKFWLLGGIVNWPELYADEQRQRLSLPTYPFERQKYWIEAPDGQASAHKVDGSIYKKPDIDDWLYLSNWTKTMLPAFDAGTELNRQALRWLVFGDECGVGAHIAKRLQQAGQTVAKVVMGERFASINNDEYVINPAQREDYEILFKELQARMLFPQHIVHCWSITADEQPLAEDQALQASQDRDFYSLLYLTQALGKHYQSEPCSIRIISNNMQAVTGEEALAPQKATMLGLCKVIPQEYLHLSCCSIDIVLPPSGSWREKILLNQLVAEIAGDIEDPVVAYRANQRWIQSFDAVHMKPQAQEPVWLRKNGVYLIVGGLGNLGLVQADYIAQRVQAKIILTSRSHFPERDTWTHWLNTNNNANKINQQIRKIQAIEGKGAEVLVLCADAAQSEQMQEVFEIIDRRFSNLHGIIYSAGLVGEASVCAIREASQATCESQFHSKVHGLQVLKNLLGDRTIDFCLLQSSLSPILGGLGFAAYAAGNAFMDAFAQKQNQINQVPWMSINWDGWDFEGHQDNLQEDRLAITPEEGEKAFARILATPLIPQIIISTGNLQARINQWIKREGLVSWKDRQEDETLFLHTRPGLQTTYVAPQTDFERTIAAIWGKMLGIKNIGVYDDFFELGGHSLLAIQVIARLRDTFQIDLPLHDLFEERSIVRWAEIIEEIIIEKLEALPEDIS